MRIKDSQGRLRVMTDITQHKTTNKLVQNHHQLVLRQLCITEFEPTLAVFHDSCEIEFEFEEFGDVFEGSVQGSGDGGEVLDLGRGWNGEGFFLWVVGADAGWVDPDLHRRPGSYICR